MTLACQRNPLVHRLPCKFTNGLDAWPPLGAQAGDITSGVPKFAVRLQPQPHGLTFWSVLIVLGDVPNVVHLSLRVSCQSSCARCPCPPLPGYPSSSWCRACRASGCE
eukprot:16245445-Heterocapsa_arctica.AAC.1